MTTAIYAMLASLATLMVAVSCWIPAAVLGLGMAYIVFRPGLSRVCGFLREHGVLYDRRAPHLNGF
jgi:hypothetical protein